MKSTDLDFSATFFFGFKTVSSTITND